MSDLTKALQDVLNSHSAENASNTPDYILAQYLRTCLNAFNVATTERERWYGYKMTPAMPDTIHRMDTP